MINPRNQTISEMIYGDIEQNEYLQELYNDLLRAYTRKLVDREPGKFDEKKLDDLLRFADILSKSTSPTRSGIHKVWSQQIVALLDKTYRGNYKIKFYKHSILASCNNFRGIQTEKSKIEGFSMFDELISLSDKEYFKVPCTENDYFFEDQKSIFDGFSHQYFSYSAPTSMGKSYVMRMFIKQQVSMGANCNFAILVPTKALINEIKSKILNDLGQQTLQEKNYRVITTANDMLLEKDHNFIFVMTPERFLYLLNTTDKRVQYLFIDEAHKISTGDARSTFYYELVDRISKLEEKPHIIFSSPNIPNPDEYLKLIPSMEGKEGKQATFSPVSQIKYLINLKEGKIEVFNDYSKKFIPTGNANTRWTLTTLIQKIATSDEQNIVYCSSLRETIDLAVDFATQYHPTLSPKTVEVLDKLSKDIKKEINSDYFLVDLIQKGVAFHVGYLPASIRNRIENAFKDHHIRTLFCTSTLIEGVNLPADNLFVTNYKNGRSNLDSVSFRNLIGRVGRIDHSLFGNVFMVCLKEAEEATLERYQELLTKEIPPQKVSIEKALTGPQKKAIIKGLVDGDFEMTTKSSSTTADEFSFMRKQALVFVKDLMKGNNSLIVRELSQYASQEEIAKIIENSRQMRFSQGIDVTPDQIRSLAQFVEQGAQYPALVNGEVKYDDCVDFLLALASVFKWHIYEKKTLGHKVSNAYYSGFTNITWYANILYKWMSGKGLTMIIRDAIRWKEDHPETGIWANNWKIEEFYNKNDPKHKNLIIADTLNTIENVILFSVANYFREFSTEYKRQHDNKPFQNDWYEYVEYGTTNSLTINLQRYGYTREASTYIMDHQDAIVDKTKPTATAPFSLKLSAIEACNDEGLKLETKEILINVPELFTE